MEREYNVGTWLTPSDEYIKDIKQTLVEKGLIKESTNDEDIAKEVEEGLVNLTPNNLRGNVKVGNVTGTLVTAIDEVNPNGMTKIEPIVFDYTFTASNGIDMYASYNLSRKTGIWHMNLKTKVLTKIYDQSYAWKYFFEDSKGNVLISNDTYNAGLILAIGSTAQKIFESYKFNTFFETSKGEIYAKGYKTIYISKDFEVTALTVGYSSVYCETTDGKLYGCNYGTDGIFSYEGANVTKIAEGYGTNLNSMLSDYDGGCYVTGSNSDILYVKNNEVFEMGVDAGGSTETVKMFFKSTKTNKIYATDNKNFKGIWVVEGATRRQIYDVGVSWYYFFESSNGKIYVSSTGNYYKEGILCIDTDETCSLIYSDGFQFSYFFENSNGDIFASSNGVNGQYGIVRIVDDTVTKILDVGVWKYFLEKEEGLLIFDTENINSNSNILFFTNNTLYKLV